MTTASQARPPSVERVLSGARPRLNPSWRREAIVEIARGVVADERERLAGDPDAAPRDASDLATELLARLDALADPLGAGLVPAINASGVILHTNLGRAPWPHAAIKAAAAAAAGYSMLEFDRDSGRRGARFRAAEEHLLALTGAEDALITNNNAAAVALAVGLAGGGGVVVSRGELVEIGGGVRIPEIVARAGGRLVEVGTTNKTRVEDYRGPLESGEAVLVLRVHPSNFRQTGFVESPEPRALADLAHATGAIVVDDLGSGALIDTADFGLAHEPTPRESLAADADLVTFSGDKLLGGPQAGLIVGRADLVAQIRKDPLARAMRPDKVSLAALSATLGLYRAGRATTDIPIWRMLSQSPTDLRRRAAAIVSALPVRTARVGVRVTPLSSALGGGSLPGEAIPSVGLVVEGRPPDPLLGRLRTGDPPIVAHVHGEAVLLDLRTVDPEDDEALAAALGRALELAR